MNFNRTEDISEELIKALRLHIESGNTGLVEIFNEWPVGNFTITHPSLSIITASDALYTPSGNKPIVLVDTIVNHEANVLRDFGFVEMDLQLDLWCKNKNQRTEMLRKLEEVLEPNNISQAQAGLHLTMPDYYNSIGSYTYSGYSYEDSEISAQRREWRAILRVKADARKLRDKLEFVMDEPIELDLETKNTAEPLD